MCPIDNDIHFYHLINIESAMFLQSKIVPCFVRKYFETI